jgi:hypothetical protein
LFDFVLFGQNVSQIGSFKLIIRTRVFLSFVAKLIDAGAWNCRDWLLSIDIMTQRGESPRTAENLAHKPFRTIR